MKKNILVPLALLAVIGIGVIIINACSKSDQEKVTSPGKITHFSPSEDQVVPLITQFKQRYENHKAGYKSGGDINLGEAEWTIEAAVNYEFRGIKDDAKEVVSDSLLLTAEVFVGENNEYVISESNALVLYDDMLNFTESKVNEGNQFLVADVNINEVNNGFATIEITTIILGGLPDPCSINSTDYWYPVMNLGKCDIYSGQGIGFDASDKIRTILNCSQTYATYWTDVELFELIYNGFYPCAEGDCFWEGGPTYCLSPSNIQYWINQAQSVVTTLKPAGKARIKAYFDYDVWVQNEYFVHYFKYISYGIPHTGGGGGEQ
jgi:hypothetical protein